MHAWQKELFFAWAFLEVSSVNNEVAYCCDNQLVMVT